MQYLVEGTRGPLPPSPEQAIALLEGVVIPAFEYVARLKAEGRMLAGGLPVGDRAFVCIIEAASNDEPDRIVREMPTWGVRMESDAAAELRGSCRNGAADRASLKVCARLIASHRRGAGEINA